MDIKLCNKDDSMDLREFKDVSLDVREYFRKEDKTKQVLEFLGNMNEVFWQSINLVHFVSEFVRKNIKHSISLPVFILSNKFINHTVASYEMLLMHLENEQVILYRQSLEVQWLIKYFIENPNDIQPWLLDKDIYARQSRHAVDNNTTTKELYKYLSSYSHPFSASKPQSHLGGLFIPEFTNSALARLLISIKDMVEHLYETIEKFGDINIQKIVENNIFNNEIEEYILISYNELQELRKSIVILSYFENPDMVIDILEKNEDYEFINFLIENYS